MPYDGAAITDSRYRQIRIRSMVADSALAGMQEEIRKYSLASTLLDSAVTDMSVAIKVLKAGNARKDSVNTVLMGNIDKLVTIAEKPKKWYQRDGIQIIITFVAVFIATKL